MSKGNLQQTKAKQGQTVSTGAQHTVYDEQERQMAIDRMAECAYWTSLIITDAQVMDRQTARKTVRRMRAD